MQRVLICVLMIGAFCVPAGADPLNITPDAEAVNAGIGAPSEAAIAAPAAVPAAPAATAGRRYAAVGTPNLGGGFIQFVFGGAAQQPAVPRAYQPAPADYQPQAAPAAMPAPMSLTVPEAEEPLASRAESDNEPAQAYAPAPASYEPTTHPPLDPRFDRQVVDYSGDQKPGTIIIDTPNKFLFLVIKGGKALRYGIGVGRPGFTWAGVKSISAMREWPDWRPPPEMIERRPDLPRYMAGGPENPLGARALYLGSTLYRIHGSNEPWTIGTNVSSGCIRMRNADVIDLYGRVKVGTKVVVI